MSSIQNYSLAGPQGTISYATIDDAQGSSGNLVSPLFDILFVCGGAPWILGLLVNFSILGQIQQMEGSAQILTGLTVIYVVLSILIGESHQFTSILRYYGTFRDRKKNYIKSRIPLWILYLAFSIPFMVQAGIFLGLPSFSMPLQLIGMVLMTLADFLISFFPFFLAQHFCGQSQAIGVMYCRMRGFELQKSEQFMITICSWSLVIAGAATIAKPFASFTASTLLLISEAFHSIFVGFAIITVFCTGLHFVFRGIETRQWLPKETVMLWTSLALFFLLPNPFMILVWIFVPLFFHASQHWAVAWHTRQNEKPGTGLLKARGKYAILDFLRMALPIQLATVTVLFWPLWFTSFGPGLNSETMSNSITLGIELSMLVFYIHYFTDRMVWRSRI